MHRGQPNSQSIINDLISGKIVLNNSNNKVMFPALNISKFFATTDYDAPVNTKIDYTINQVFHSMTVQELNTLLTVCELEQNQLLTILAFSVQNSQRAGFLLTGNCGSFFCVEGSTAWLYDCPHFLSLLYKDVQCFNRIPINFKGILIYVDSPTIQSIIELDLDFDDQGFYIL